MSGERYYTTKIWQRLSSIGFSSAAALSTSMDPRGEPVISTWKRPCQKIQNGSEFPELVAQNFRNPQYAIWQVWGKFRGPCAFLVPSIFENANPVIRHLAQPALRNVSQFVFLIVEF